MRSARIVSFCLVFLTAAAMAQSILTIEQPLAPTAAQPGGGNFTLTIDAAGLNAPNGAPTAVVWQQGTTFTSLPITSSTATQITLTVPAANIASAGTALVSVKNSAGITSNAQFFQIATPASPQFGAPVDYNPGLSTVQYVLVADLNGDGIPDLAVGSASPPSSNMHQVAVFLANSDGTFGSPTTYSVDDASSIVAGVFNSDGGSIDLIAGDTHLVNNGSGVFTANPLVVGVSGFVPYAVGDFSQTGVLDIAGLLNGAVRILTNSGSGTFGLGQNFSPGTTQFAGMLTADFNGDGFLDLAILDIYAGSPNVTVFFGSATGFNVDTFATTSTPAGGVAFAAADFNGDDKQDLAFVYNPSSGGQVLILNGKGDGSFTSGFTTPLANAVSGAIVTGDFNEDKKLDLATGTYILPGNGDGTFQTPPIDLGGTSQVLATGDFNNDGRPDLVGQASPDVAILLQQAPGIPGAMLSPSPTLNFTPNQPLLVGTSASLPVTLTNTGTAPLSIASIGLSGTNASEFMQNNNCGTSLAADSSCTINVTFTAATNGGSGSASATLSVSDNAAPSPQTVSVTGNVQNFALSTTCVSLTVVPGQSAIYTVDLAPVNGFTQSVALSCSGAPALATCTPAPNSIALSGTATVQAQVTATTTRATGSLRPPFERFPGDGSNQNRLAGLAGMAGLAGFVALVLLPIKAQPGKRYGKSARRGCGLIFLLCILAVITTLPSCGGSGGGTDPPGTAPGTYPLTVTATFQPTEAAPVTETVSFNLVVQ